MNSDLQNIRTLLRETRGDLMKKRNVLATGIGFKTTAGRETSELAIVCLVESKKPVAKLSSADLVPPMIQHIPTDVKQTGIIRAFQAPTARFRPAPGGCSIGHYQITAGTLGCLVRKNNALYILSNNHVLANSNEATSGDAILQPGSYDGGRDTDDRIGTLSEFVPISFEELSLPDCPIADWTATILNKLASMTGSTIRLRPYRVQLSENKVDCALAKPLQSNDVKNEIYQLGPITGTQDAELGMKIKKSGRTTGVTTGTIEQIDVSARVSYGSNKVALFTDQLLAGPMSQGGDSGSAVLNENNRLVGLLFAGSESTTIINRIGNVFNALGVSLA